MVKATMLVAVTPHAAERFRQRVRGTLDAKTEIAARVAAYEQPPPAYETGAMAKYARLVSSASAGAVTG